jgi:hypothetical protein
MRTVLVELIGDKLDIEELQSGLSSDSWVITLHEGKYYLSSKFLDTITSNREIVFKATEFLDLINGAASVLYSNHSRVEIGNLKIMGNNGVSNVLIAGTGYIKLRSRVRGTLTTKDKESSKPTIETWLDKSNSNPNIRDALHFFNEITWWNLYKIYEIISDDTGGQKGLYKLGGKTELSLFTQAAQSRELLGDKARHASKKYKPPSKNLTIEQATDIIVKLFKNWVDIK